MSHIKKLIGNKSFVELKNELTNEPYFLEIKENDDKYMLLFTEKSDLTLQEVRESTGIIFEKKTNKLLHFSFPKCYEGINDINEITLLKSDLYELSNIVDYKINLYFTGSMIKLYYTENNGWQIASSKNLDASKSFWGSKKSFKELFIDAIEISENVKYFDFLEKLDPNFCYTYIIQHPDINSLIKVNTPLAFILNKVNLETLKEEIPDIDHFSVEKAIHEVNKQSEGITKNYLIYNMDKDNKVISRIKILNQNYQKLKGLYGNYPDIGLRYIEVINNELLKKKLREEFSHEKFNKIDILYNKTIKCIEMSYKNVYINNTRTFNNIPKSHIKIIQYMKLHEIDAITYLQNKNPKEIAYIIMYTY